MINTEDDDKYLLFGDTLQVGSLSNCGGPSTISVMCEEMGEKIQISKPFDISRPKYFVKWRVFLIV